MVAQIKDPTLRDEYARQLAGWVGWDDVAQVLGRVREEAGRKPGARAGGAPTPPPHVRPVSAERPDPRDPTLWPQREALKAALQYPGAGRSGVRFADPGEFHPSRLRGGAHRDRARPAEPRQD